MSNHFRICLDTLLALKIFSGSALIMLLKENTGTRDIFKYNYWLEL